MFSKIVFISFYLTLSSCSGFKLKKEEMKQVLYEKREPTSAKSCVGEICIGDQVYPHTLQSTDPMEVLKFQPRHGLSVPNVDPYFDYHVVLKNNNPLSTHQLTESFREVYLDAGPSACLDFENNPSLKVCVGETIVLFPFLNYSFPQETKVKLKAFQAKTDKKLIFVKVLKVLRSPLRGSNRVEARAIVDTMIPGIGEIMISDREIGFTKEGLCVFSSPEICIGSNYTTFYNEAFSVIAYMPSGNNGLGVVLTTKLLGLNNREELPVNEDFNRLVDPRFKVQNVVFKKDNFIQVGMKDSDHVAMDKMKQSVILHAQDVCSRRIWNRGLLDSSKPIEPKYSQCEFDIDSNKYVGHGAVIGKTTPKRYLSCVFEVEVTCIDKDFLKQKKVNGN